MPKLKYEKNIAFTTSTNGVKERFIPIDPNCIKMYVCGPTVYDRPHLGNARSCVVYDVLYRTLLQIYPKVLYVRNITDVDDKIINIAKENNESIHSITSRVTKFFHEDMLALNCMLPSVEPRATENIDAMIEIIERLLSLGFAYTSDHHVLFNVSKFPDYGALSKRNLSEMIEGARIEVASYKKNPTDFILWKPAAIEEAWCSFDSPWGLGRPGWHIECSAMSMKYLGQSFDIHGGGVDLIFPHHENEVAQSRCYSNDVSFAKYWIHNGFLTINGEKMSKSLGNFKTVRDVLDDGIDGTTLRYFYLTTQYRKPQDFNEKALYDSKKALEKFFSAVRDITSEVIEENTDLSISNAMRFLCDDLNTPALLSYMHKIAASALKGNEQHKIELKKICDIIGLDFSAKLLAKEYKIEDNIHLIAEERVKAKLEKNWVEADLLRAKIERLGYSVIDTSNGYRLEKNRK